MTKIIKSFRGFRANRGDLSPLSIWILEELLDMREYHLRKKVKRNGEEFDFYFHTDIMMKNLCVKRKNTFLDNFKVLEERGYIDITISNVFEKRDGEKKSIKVNFIKINVDKVNELAGSEII